MEYYNTDTKGVVFPKTAVGKRKLDLICDIAISLFYKNGIFDTQVLDICNSANIAVGTFYSYFEDRNTLFRYLVENIEYDLSNSLKLELEGTQNLFAGTKLMLFAKTYLRYMLENRCAYIIVWGSAGIDRLVHNECMECFVSLYQSYLQEGEHPINQDIDSVTLCHFMVGGLNLLCLKLSQEGYTEDSIDRAIEEIIKRVLREDLNNI